MRRARTIIKGDATVEGGPIDVAGAIGARIITPAAETIMKECGHAALIEFYTALTARLVCEIAIVLGAEPARRVAHAAVSQIDAAIALGAQHRPGVH